MGKKRDVDGNDVERRNQDRGLLKLEDVLCLKSGKVAAIPIQLVLLPWPNMVAGVALTKRVARATFAVGSAVIIAECVDRTSP